MSETGELPCLYCGTAANNVKIGDYCCQADRHLHDAAVEIEELRNAGVHTVLHCPDCHELHIDEGEWATKPHRTHLCNNCGRLWKPYPVATYGCWPGMGPSEGSAARGLQNVPSRLTRTSGLSGIQGVNYHIPDRLCVPNTNTVCWHIVLGYKWWANRSIEYVRANGCSKCFLEKAMKAWPF